jgi:hypothetical protein
MLFSEFPGRSQISQPCQLTMTAKNLYPWLAETVWGAEQQQKTNKKPSSQPREDPACRSPGDLQALWGRDWEEELWAVLWGLERKLLVFGEKYSHGKAQKREYIGRCQWLIPITLATWETEIGDLNSSSTWAKVCKIPSRQKKAEHGGTPLSSQVWQEA